MKYLLVILLFVGCRGSKKPVNTTPSFWTEFGYDRKFDSPYKAKDTGQYNYDNWKNGTLYKKYVGDTTLLFKGWENEPNLPWQWPDGKFSNDFPYEPFTDTVHCEPLTTDTLKLIQWHQDRLMKLMRGNRTEQAWYIGDSALKRWNAVITYYDNLSPKEKDSLDKRIMQSNYPAYSDFDKPKKQ